MSLLAKINDLDLALSKVSTINEAQKLERQNGTLKNFLANEIAIRSKLERKIAEANKILGECPEVDAYRTLDRLREALK
jgi:hypothetical protein